MKSKDEFVIREYLPGDKEQVLNLQRIAMEKIGVYRLEPHWNEDLDTIETTYGEGKGVFLVGTIGDRIVAMGALKKTGAAEAEIRRMRVMPGIQGRGLGKEIYKVLEQRAITWGIKHLRLETSTQQENAKKLYQAVGFNETARKIIAGFDCIIYEKKLP